MKTAGIIRGVAVLFLASQAAWAAVFPAATFTDTFTGTPYTSYDVNVLRQGMTSASTYGTTTSSTVFGTNAKYTMG